MTAPDFIGQPDYEAQLDELDRRMEEKRFDLFETLLLMIEHQIGAGLTVEEAFADARKVIATLRRMPT